ncbi:MAG: nucleotide pyrophosphatase/phosphodiesterase family protein [Planctomycetota bacterium]
MPHRTAVILIVGLTESLIGDDTPKLRAFRKSARCAHLDPPTPAVTCTSQASMLTGLEPSDHGIIGNGWYDRESAEIRFWRQSNRLVRGERVWETARHRDPSVTCAKLFWWFNMHSSADVSITPRPIYKADGRKTPDVYAEPPDLREELQTKLGRFPLFNFWGPAASIESSRWIARSAEHCRDRFDPTLSLVYLPHLDYALQKYGPGTPEASAALRAIDEVAGSLIERLEAGDTRVIVVSEYGLESATGPVHINRVLREAGLLRVRDEDGADLLDPGGSRAFAVADHQVAHVYVRDVDDLARTRQVCESLDGVDLVLDQAAQREAKLWCDRSAELLLVAQTGRWFTYYPWLDDARAPDFARTVEIHRKPGYDPCELFVDPALGNPKLAVGRRLLMKKLGFRALMDVIPLDATLVRGTHGRPVVGADGPLLIARGGITDGETVPMTAVRDVILSRLFSAR